MDDSLTYEKALTELQEIVKNLESGEINLDEVTEKVKRAGFLVEFCQKKLRSLEKDMENIFEQED